MSEHPGPNLDPAVSRNTTLDEDYPSPLGLVKKGGKTIRGLFVLPGTFSGVGWEAQQHCRIVLPGGHDLPPSFHSQF